MKQFLLVTAILFVAIVGCERHRADEPSSPHAPPIASHQEEAERGGVKWDLVGLGLILVTALAVHRAWRTEQVFREMLKTLEHAQDRAREAGSVQTMITCIEQFQNLENQKRSKTVDAERYFEMLWNLHFEEYHFFVRGFLPRDVYAIWVWIRYRGYRRDESKSSLGMSESDGWNHAKDYLQNDDFVKFVESWLAQPDLKKADVERIVMNKLQASA